MKAQLTSIARQAGGIMMRHFRKLHDEDIERKTNVKDLVTYVDREVESIVMDRLRHEFPDHGLLGEESGLVKEGKGAYFVIDPLDGTVNYTHGVPHFALSIACVENGRTTHGLIFQPAFDEMYYAEIGAGASLNGEKLHVSDKNNLAESLVATGFACIRAEMNPDGMPIFNKLIYRTRDLRRLGAATIDLAYTARGIFDGFYEMGLSPWDVRAGALLVEEAGGVISGFADESDPLEGNKIMASNGLIHDELKGLIEEALKSA